MPRGPRDEKRRADASGNAVMIAAGEIDHPSECWRPAHAHTIVPSRVCLKLQAFRRPNTWAGRLAP